ncbi:MAG TPA: hypothetical protein VMC62_06140 [Longilinea sp.]|nr:hypothetical protein [Longilinea sp.]
MKKLLLVLDLLGISILLVSCTFGPQNTPIAITPTSISVVSPPLNPPTVTPVIPTATPVDTPTVPTPTSSIAMVSPIDAAVNCRFGPSANFLAVGALKTGITVPILGTNSDQSWWMIQNPQDVAGQYCWVANSVVVTSGDLSKVPVKPIPIAQVTSVSVDPIANIYGVCGGPNAYDPQGSITTNGPTTVTYHWEIWRSGSLFHKTADETLVFSSASTQTVNPGSDHGDCDDYVVKLIVISPNSMSAQQSFKIAAATVTSVHVDSIATIHGFCHGPNAFDPQGTITTNGPAAVVYHWEILYNGSAYHATSDDTLTFGSASTQTLNPGSDHGDCGNYTVKLIVTSPNSVSAQQSFTVVEP